MKCFYCESGQVDAEVVCYRCGSAICAHHSTEDGTCRVGGDPIHMDPGGEEWITETTEAIEEWPEFAEPRMTQGRRVESAQVRKLTEC